jgi:hypothetical protein
MLLTVDAIDSFDMADDLEFTLTITSDQTETSDVRGW